MAHRAGAQVSLLPPSSNPSAAASHTSLPPLLRCVSSWAAYGGSLVQIAVLLGARKSTESGWRKAALSVIFGEDASSLEPVLHSERLQEADPAATRLTRLPPSLGAGLATVDSVLNLKSAISRTSREHGILYRAARASRSADRPWDGPAPLSQCWWTSMATSTSFSSTSPSRTLSCCPSSRWASCFCAKVRPSRAARAPGPALTCVLPAPLRASLPHAPVPRLRPVFLRPAATFAMGPHGRAAGPGVRCLHHRLHESGHHARDRRPVSPRRIYLTLLNGPLLTVLPRTRVTIQEEASDADQVV